MSLIENVKKYLLGFFIFAVCFRAHAFVPFLFLLGDDVRIRDYRGAVEEFLICFRSRIGFLFGLPFTNFTPFNINFFILASP